MSGEKEGEIDTEKKNKGAMSFFLIDCWKESTSPESFEDR